MRLTWLGLLGVIAGLGGMGCTSPLPVYAGAAAASKGKLVDSDCQGIEGCEAQCRRNDVPACTKVADLVSTTDWDRAEGLWTASCDRGDARACTRAMAVSSGTEADLAAARACAANVASACGILGRVQMLRGLNSRSGVDQRRLHDDASSLLERACRLDDWVGCISAWVARLLSQGAGARAKAGALLARGRMLAETACDGDDALACIYLGEVHFRGDPASAGRYYARACALRRQAVTAESAEHQEEAAASEECRRADRLRAPLPALPPPRQSPARSGFNLERLEGFTQVHPIADVKTAMHRRGLNKISSTFQVCVSPVGLVEGLAVLNPSKSPAWDLQLFATIRRWRYRPYDPAGEHTSACSRQTFIYHQR